MRHHSIRLLIESSLIAILLMIIVIGCGVLWVVTGPRSVDFLSPRIEQAMQIKGAGYKVKIQNTILTWDSWQHPVGVEIRNVRFLTEKDVIFASLPDISLRFDFTSLLMGNVIIQSLTVKHPSINLFQSSDGELNFGLESGGITSTIPLKKVLAGSIGSDKGEDATIRNIFIQDADVKIGSHDSGVYFRAPASQFRLLHTSEGIKGFVDLPIRYDNRLSSLRGALSYNEPAGNMAATIDFHHIVPKMISRIIASGGMLDAFDLPISGKAQMTIGSDGVMQQMNFLLEADKGTFTMPDYFAEPIEILHFSTKGTATRGFETIKLQEGLIEFDEPKIKFTATMQKEDAGYRIKADTSGENMQIDHLYRYWPTTLAPMTREWVTTNITTGIVPKASASFNFAPGDLDLPAPPKESVSAKVEIKGATVDYLTGYPKATNINGTARFTGTTMDVDIDSGEVLKATKIDKGLLTVPDLYAPDTRMTINIHVKAPAGDAITLIDLPDIDAAKPLGLNASTAAGNFTGEIKLDFIAFSEQPKAAGATDWDSVSYNIVSMLENVSQPKFMGDLDIEKLNGDLSIDNKHITFKGQGIANAIPASIDLLHNISSKAAFDTKYSIVTALPVTALPRFGYPQHAFLTGDLGVKATVQEKGDTQTTEAEINLDKAAIDFSKLGFTKAANSPASLKLNVTEAVGKPLRINHFVYAGQNAIAEGTAGLTSDLGELAEISFSKLDLGGTKLTSLNYTATKDGFNLVMAGPSLDLNASQKTNQSFSIKDIPAVNARINIQKLIVSDGAELHNVEGTITCNQTICTSTSVKGSDRKGQPFSFNIGSDSGARQLHIAAADAGEFLRGLGMFDNMEGGSLTVTGNFDDTKATHPLDGKLIITEHSTRKTPALTKLVTLASLTGILDTLGGKGITFKKLSAPFILQNDVITLKDAKSYGPALGLTAEGTIDIAEAKMNIKGTIVPSYTLNSMLGNIPLVGTVLTGGKGGGIFAASYSMKGDYADPAVSVNPLTILTPGFLRGLFDIFDEPADKNSEKPNTPEKNISPASQ